MYTLNEIQKHIYRIYDGGDVSYPDSTSDDYLLRTGIINTALYEWSQAQGTKWRELFTDLADSLTGDKTTTANDTVYDAPTDLVFITSQVKITSSDGSLYYSYKDINDVQSAIQNNSTERFFYITGKPGAYKIHINPAPTSTGSTIDYEYFKRVTELSSTSDVAECPNPLYLVYFTVARLYENDNRNDLAQAYEQRAVNIMNQMIIDNYTYPYNNPQSIPNLSFKLNSSRFGK